jgi:hypothetical protein
MAAADRNERRRRCTAEEVAAALAVLEPGTRIAAADWPADLERLDEPGLYSWWVDTAGARDLQQALEHEISPGRIYAGLTGATKWPSGKAGKMTLRTRIGGNHLGGTINGSTFRRTLAAILRSPLDLCLESPGRLSRDSEKRVSAWMREHLEVAVHPFSERDPLASLEHEVLAVFDPPLNLDGMPSTPIRERIRALRTELGR